MTTKPLTSNLAAPLSSSANQPLRTAHQRGMSYQPSDEARSHQLPRGTADRSGMYLPDDRSAALVPPRGTERGRSSLPYDEGSRLPLPYDEGGRLPLLPRGADQSQALLPSDNYSRPLMSRAPTSCCSSMRYPSDHYDVVPQQARGNERGGIFYTSDDHALTSQVEQLHYPDARNVDVRPLFRLVQDIIDRSTQTNEADPLGTLSKRESAIEGRSTFNGLQEVPELPLIVERISCEMTCNVLSGVDAHNTTLAVLSLLQHFSWEAKVVLTLAAFSLTYGDFWLLVQIYSTNALGKAMALIKRLPMVVESSGGYKQQFEPTNNLIKAMLETTRCIVEFGELPPTYVTSEDPEVKAALTHFPIAVYWVVRSAIAAATHITTMSSRGLEYGAATTQSWELSNWAHKLKNISDHLRETLSELHRLIGEKRDIDAYNMIVRIVYHTIHVDNQKVLITLISDIDTEPPLYDGRTKQKVHLDELRRKNVLLLISGLDIIQEELFILEQSYTDSTKHSYEIIWIPVVDRSIPWTNEMQAKLERLQASMPWYYVHHPKVIGNAVIKFFRHDWHFRGKPILVVLDPLGKVVSPNAIHMMYIWQNEAFPFTTIREQALWEKETWKLELLVNGIDPKIIDWIEEEKYIFIFGGDDLEWIRKFTKEAHAVATALQISIEMAYVGRSHNKEQVKRVTEAIMVEQLSHCWQDYAMIWFFWTRIESMLFSKIQLERIHDHDDDILQEIQRLHSYDKSHSGWAILAHGSKIVVHGHGKLALNTLVELELWKQKALDEGFHHGFRHHYDNLFRVENPCHKIEFPATVKYPKLMLCPECRRNMQHFNSFICCHEEDGIAGPESPHAFDN